MILHPDNFLREYSKAQALSEALRLTEKKIDCQLAVATAADQRAYAFCAVIFVVLAITVDFVSQDGARIVELILLVFFGLSVALAAYSARPVRFYDPGATSETFANFLDEASVGYVIAGLIDRNQRNIIDNEAQIKRAARFFRFSLVLAALGMTTLLGDVVLQTVEGSKPCPK
ncbi:MAG: hypothetical protein AAF231_09630 [Pseudomonadota bacterium]